MKATEELSGGIALSLPIVALLGGYIFVTAWNITKVWCWQFSGHRLYFAYATAGGIWLFIARALQVVYKDGTYLSIVDTLTPVLLLFTILTLLLGAVGHMIFRVATWIKHPIKVCVLGTIGASILTTSTVANMSELAEFANQFGRSQFLVATVTCIIAIAMLAPWYNNRVVHIEDQGRLHSILLQFARPQMRSGLFSGWLVASFRLGLAGLTFTLAMLAFVTSADPVSAVWETYAPVQYLGLFALTFALAACAPWLLNLLVSKDVAKDYSVRRGYEDKLEALFWESQVNEKLVEVDLDNGKVYVGWILQAPASFAPEQTYIALLPLYSGYRTTEKHQLVLTTFYHEVYTPDGETLDFARRKSLGPKFKKVVDADRIVTATQFDANAYTAFLGADSEPVTSG